MPNLFDTITQNYGQLAGQQNQQIPQGQTAQAANLFAAKSGKGGLPAPTSNMSNVQEQSANDQTQQQLRLVNQQAQVQNTNLQNQVQSQNAAAQQQSAGITQATKFDNQQTQTKVTQILQDLSQQKGQLNSQQYQAQMEQAAFMMSMQNKQYVEQLTQAGNMNRLNDQANFSMQIQQTALGDNLSILQSKLGTTDVLESTNRDFQTAMSKLNINDAQQVAQIEMANNQAMANIKTQAMENTAAYQASAANTAAKYQAATSILGGGIGAVGAGAAIANQPDTTPSDTGAVGSSSSGTF